MPRRFLSSRLALSILTFALVSAAPTIGAAGEMSDPATFFGTINEIEGARVDELRSRLIAISEQCTKLEKRCPAGDELFALFAGSFNLASQPIHVIYIDDNNMVRTNVLLHHRRVTPFLYGQRNVWLVVFAENQLDLMAELTTLWRQGKGSLSRLGGIFVSEGRETVEAREAQTEETPLVLDRLGGAAADDALYYSAGRFFLEPLGVYSTSVFPVESPSEAEAGFVEARANFSNSMSRSLDLGLALGATLRTEEVDQDILDGVSVGQANLNLYLMADIYIIKPAVLSPMVDSFWGRYRPSVGIAIGTNLKFWDAKEINIGVSLGHLVGRHGLVFGVNIIDAPDSSGEGASGQSDDRLIRPYIAGLFKF